MVVRAFQIAHAKQISSTVKLPLCLECGEAFSVSGAQETWEKIMVKLARDLAWFCVPNPEGHKLSTKS